MAIIVKENGGDFQRPDPGMHQAVCSNVYDLGLQPGYQGVITHKLVILWELEETIKTGDFAGKRFTISKFYTASLNEKANLRADLVSWRGREFTEAELKAFDVEKVIGANCWLNIVAKTKPDGKITTTIAAVAPFKRKEGGPEAMTPELPRDYQPDWIKKLLVKEGLPGEPGGKAADDFEDDIPF
jgi:hypothetical protein